MAEVMRWPCGGIQNLYHLLLIVTAPSLSLEANPDQEEGSNAHVVPLPGESTTPCRVNPPTRVSVLLYVLSTLYLMDVEATAALRIPCNTIRAD